MREGAATTATLKVAGCHQGVPQSGASPNPAEARCAQLPSQGAHIPWMPGLKPGLSPSTFQVPCVPTWAEVSTAACTAAGVRPQGAAAAAQRWRVRPPAKSPAPPRNTARSAPSHPSSRSSPSSTLRKSNGRCQCCHLLRAVTNAVTRPSPVVKAAALLRCVRCSRCGAL